MGKVSLANMKFWILNIIYIILGILLLPALSAQAQLRLPGGASLSIKISPEFPDPGAEVRAELLSYSLDVNRASITWALDGKALASGVGVKEVSFKAAAHGAKNTLSASATSPGGERFETSVVIRPQSVDLILDAKSRVPHWYRGAALPISRTRVVVSAIPNFISSGARINPSSLQYEWRVDRRLISDFSGRGKDSISVLTPGLGEVAKEVMVKVSSSDASLVKEARAMVQAFSPEILFYERLPLEGIKTSLALRTKNLFAGGEFEVQAVPFSMNYSSLSDLSFSWSFDGNATDPLSGEPDTLLVKTGGGSEGQSGLIGILVSNLKTLFESVNASFDVNIQ
ncbi:hypothetical protein A2757_00335 [Candidatus Giovannonibacteria bacterium RIFCSPHIGHO2_01_FULL_48_47]|nr:MAG: hypothetical protein A2757_00335 [Candidatus Giovannonibacteria bacterium RIFCSPHIGHO2_01_FULL_48_47]OGF68737.1 MAG: hypothetical protein A3D61_01445 [Candidatus Giovannonibacteria bacterium RIFCSPHIGHO2_02_FULL_48_15]OGF89652.1 MAG: hypothetical protein A3B26_02865 [Candidatus Giovannonibacteria bacterium RIFCSPLOWO2_01_FULL_48_47]OGF96330.1 MAG: hypothetical protein A2613_02095 [Candidatus Giovannonibacteria bacterium RIFOXYD1_FULL_48_21]HBT81755.1 hypothetical protein [Candidatus Gio